MEIAFRNVPHTPGFKSLDKNNLITNVRLAPFGWLLRALEPFIEEDFPAGEFVQNVGGRQWVWRTQ